MVPLVSIVVCHPSAAQSLMRLCTEADCKSGSPPVTTTWRIAPIFCFNMLNASPTLSVYGLPGPNDVCAVSHGQGLPLVPIQMQRKLHPCNLTNIDGVPTSLPSPRKVPLSDKPVLPSLSGNMPSRESMRLLFPIVSGKCLSEWRTIESRVADASFGKCFGTQ